MNGLTAETPGATEYNPKRVIKRSDADEKSVKYPVRRALIVSVVCISVVIFLMIITEKSSSLISLGPLLACIMLARKAVLEQFVAVCEGCVYGRGIKKRLFKKNEWFDVGYDRITGVEKIKTPFGVSVRIKCGPDTYECIVSEPDEIINLIKERISPIAVGRLAVA